MHASPGNQQNHIDVKIDATASLGTETATLGGIRDSGIRIDAAHGIEMAIVMAMHADAWRFTRKAHPMHT